MKNNTARSSGVPDLPCALTDNSIELPVLDITHPLFKASIDENVYRISCANSLKQINSIKKMPVFLQKLFIKISNVEDSKLTGMRTLLYKLGPGLAKGRRLSFRDRWAVKQGTFMGLRIRLRDICTYQAEILIPMLKESPDRNLCFFNIAGGPSSDSINTLILIQEADPELLKGRKIEIDTFDIDTFGPNFAKRCIDALKMPGRRFHGLDITFRAIPYDWSRPEDLSKPMLEKAGWIQICSSEGGLFEYGSDEDILENLNRLYANSADDMRVAGSLIFDKAGVNPGYLGFAEFTGIRISFLGLSGLARILSQTKWVLENKKEIDTIFTVFTLKKEQL